MSAAGVVIIDDARGEAAIGPLRVPVVAGRSGELWAGGRNGPLLRPAKFAERWQAVMRAAPSPNPVESLCAALVKLSVIEPGIADGTVVDILALHLAGAGSAAPPYAEALLLVARAAGWSYPDVSQATALDVDHLAQAIAAQAGHGAAPPEATGWQRINFWAWAAHEDILAALRDDLASDLLARGSTHANYSPTASALPNSGLESTASAGDALSLCGASTPLAGPGIHPQRVVPGDAIQTSPGTESLPVTDQQQTLHPVPAITPRSETTGAAARARPLRAAGTKPAPPRFVRHQVPDAGRAARANLMSPSGTPQLPVFAGAAELSGVPGTLAVGGLMAVLDTRLPPHAERLVGESSTRLPADQVTIVREELPAALLAMSFTKEPAAGSSPAFTADVQNLDGLADALQDEADARGLDR